MFFLPHLLANLESKLAWVLDLVKATHSDLIGFAAWLARAQLELHDGHEEEALDAEKDLAGCGAVFR